MRWTMNVNGQRVPDKASFRTLIARLGLRSLVVMDDLTFAHQCKDTLGANAVVAHRAFSETEAHRNRNPEELAEEHARQGYGDVSAYGPNEPGADAALIDWEVRRLTRSSQVGVRCVALNLGPGNVDRAQVESGLFDPLLRFLADHPEHVLGMHEYTGVLLVMGVGYPGFSQCDWRDAPRYALANWPTRAQVESIPVYEGRWHIRRSDWILARCDVLGIRRPRVLVTEWGWDRMPDWEGASCGNIYQQLEAQFGIANGHLNIRGVDTLQNVYQQHFYPGQDFQELIFQQIQWMETIYPPEYIGYAQFAWCPGAPDWDAYYGFDVSRYTHLFDLIANWQTTPPPDPLPAFPPTDTFAGWRYVWMKGNDPDLRTNIRATPEIAPGNIVGSLTNRVWRFGQTHRHVSYQGANDPASWVPVLWPKRNADQFEHGWIRTDVFDQTPIPVSPDAPREDREVDVEVIDEYYERK